MLTRRTFRIAGFGVVVLLALTLVPSVWAASPLVLQARDAPGLRPARGTVAAGRLALAAALRPARLPALSGDAQVAHFKGREGTDLWSLALVVKSPRAAETVLRSIATSARRAHLIRVRADVGDSGWVLRRRTRGSRPIVVVWRSNRGLGTIVLRAPRASRSLAKAYALLAAHHLTRALTQPAWERTLGGIRPNGKVPRKVAFDLFALAYGALPGTKVPPGPYGPVHEGTMAARHILRLWSTLTPAQQDVAKRALGITGVDVSQRSDRVLAEPWWDETQAAGARSDYGDPGFKQDPLIQSIADRWVAEFNKHLPKLSLQIVAGKTTSAVPTKGGGDAAGDATLVTPDGLFSWLKSDICRIRITSAGLQGTPLVTFVLAHEVFHCFEADIQRRVSLPQFAGSDWLIEGLADWAALAVDPVTWDVAGGTFQEYFESCADRALFARTYDAVGFFGHAEDSIGELWSRIPAMLGAGYVNRKVYQAAGGEEAALLDSWASSVYLKPWGLPWTAVRPIAPPGNLNCPTTPVSEGPVQAAPFVLSPYEISADDPERPLLHLEIKGHARLGDGRLDRTDLSDAWFCLKEKCECPKDEEGTPPPAPPLKPGASLALTGGPEGAKGTLKLSSLKEYCKKKQKKPPAPRRGPPIGGGGAGSGCSTGCGSSFADPHLTTFDGTFYDFQAAGEFTLARSRVDGFEVQVRQEPVPGSTRFAVNTGVAMRVGTDRVGVYRGSPLVVRVNGLGFLPSKGYRRLPNGGQVRLISEDDVEVTWPDRTIARVHAESDSWVSVLVKPALSRRGTLTGLLGNFDGNLKNDFVTRSGRRLAGDVVHSYRLLYRTLGESWRVAQRRSMFDYARGQSTRTFANRRFPGRVVSAADLPKRVRERAERTCRRIGIRNQAVLQSCVLDVGATGDNRFATSSRRVERIARRFGRPSRRGGEGGKGKGNKGGACKPKTTTIGGQTAVVFCGPAVATIKAVGRTFRIKGGSCVIQAGNLFAALGTIGGPSQGGLQTSPLFYLLFDPANASQGGILYWIVDGKRYRAAKGARITLVGTRVTFSGELDRGVGATGSGPFSGTLACGASLK